jgi:hypothetical protein
MKKVIQLILIISIVSTAVSCNQKTTKKQEKQQPKEEVTKTHEKSSALQLNNGLLWRANSETTTGINNMIGTMNAFSDKENINAYAALKKQLEIEFNTIITECTMEGESHNQLHNFLVPMKSLFDGLSSSNLTVCKKSFNTLNKHLLEYSNYFE